MTLPYTDPAIIGSPTSYFQDNSFVRGDQMRANNQKLWGNLQYLDYKGQQNLYNLRVTVSGNTVTLTGWTGSLSTSNPGYVVMPDPRTAGLLVPITITADISVTLPSSGANQRICGINTTDGQATYAVNGLPNNGVTNAIEWFFYILYDFTTSTPYIGLNKSPLLYVLAADYLYGCTASTISKAGAGDTAWNAMVTSNSTIFVTPSSVGCVTIGPALTAQISGGSLNAGWWSGIAIQSGYVPKWNDRIPKVKSQIISYGLASAITHGSTDTCIRKINPPATNTGDKLQYFSAGGTVASGGVGGAEFYCTVDGYYHFKIFDCFSSASDMGISINSSQRTTGVALINSANIASHSTTSLQNYTEECNYDDYIPAGTIVRFHDSATPGGIYAQGAYCYFIGFELT